MHENPDLFARVTRSLEDARCPPAIPVEARGLRSPASSSPTSCWRSHFSDFDNRRFNMPWWVIELITNIVLVALAVGLGPFIKRFGRSYAADVFRANPRTGKSYLVLTDVAYYLIFTSFVLFTVTFVEPVDWVVSTGNAAEARGRPRRRDPADHGHPPRGQRRRLADHRRLAVQQQAARWPAGRCANTGCASVGPWNLDPASRAGAGICATRSAYVKMVPATSISTGRLSTNRIVILIQRRRRHPSSCGAKVALAAAMMVP